MQGNTVTIYNTKFSTNSIWKKKNRQRQFWKKNKKTIKNHVGKHCSNLKCFKEKKNYEAKFNQLHIKKIKSTKTILKKNIKKWKKKEILETKVEKWKKKTYGKS
jgi:hypothetical protein